MRSINDIVAYNRLTQYEKRMYKAGLVDKFGVLTDEGEETLLQVLLSQHAEEMATLADQKMKENETK